MRKITNSKNLAPKLLTGLAAAIFAIQAQAGLVQGSVNDTDGKPVDVLDIQGNIDSNRARGMEDLLWNLIPEAQYLRDELGTFDGAGEKQISHTLALSQLLITYHMVKAALGHHAL